MPPIDVQPREAQLILDQLGAYLQGGIRLRFMDPLEAQVIIGFCKKLKEAADYRPPIRVQVEVTVIREEEGGP